MAGGLAEGRSFACEPEAALMLRMTEVAGGAAWMVLVSDYR